MAGLEIPDFHVQGRTVSFGVLEGTVLSYDRRYITHVSGGGPPGAPVSVSSSVSHVHSFWIERDDGEQFHIENSSAPENFSLLPGQRVRVISGQRGSFWSWLWILNLDAKTGTLLNPGDWFLRKSGAFPRLRFKSVLVAAVLVAALYLGPMLLSAGDLSESERKDFTDVVVGSAWGVFAILLIVMVMWRCFRRIFLSGRMERHIADAIVACREAEESEAEDDGDYQILAPTGS